MKKVCVWVLSYEISKYGEKSTETLLDNADQPFYTEETALQQLLAKQNITHGKPVYDENGDEVLDENGDPVYKIDEASFFEYYYDGEQEVGWQLSRYIWEFIENPAPGEPPMKLVSADINVARG